MAETASVLCPEKRVLIPDLDAGCSLADSITAAQLRAWKAQHPGAIVVMYVNTTAEVKAETDYCCTSANAVAVVEHIYREHGADTEILFGPDMFLGAYVEKTLGRRMHVWDGECHVHAGIRPSDINAVRAAHPGAEFLIHPECGCSTSVMEYVAAGDVDSEGVHMLSTGGMLSFAREHHGGTAIVATETGMLYPLRQADPDTEFIAANEAAQLPLHEDDHAAQAPRRPARRRPRGQGRSRDRGPRPGADRADGRDRLRAGPGGRGRRYSASRSTPLLGGIAHGRHRDALALELGGRVAVDVRRGPHLERVPQRAGLVDALEPRHAVERLGDEHDHELGSTLALGRRAALVGDAGAAEDGASAPASGRRYVSGSRVARAG